jgi:hypothetical protein
MRHNERGKFFLTAFRRKICDIHIGQIFIPKHMEKKMNKSKLIWKLNRLMVSGLLGLLAVISLNTAVNAQSNTQSCKSATKPCAEFERIWIDYDVMENGLKGMLIHTKLSVYRMKGVASAIAISFQTGDGKKLRDKNKIYYAPNGDVSVQRELRIDFDPGAYSDLTVFMPYSELDLSPGEYDLKMDVDLIYKSGTLIQHLTFEDFVYKQPDLEVEEAPLPPADNTPVNQKATLEKVWVDYDIMRNGKRGMLIHVNFTVRALKGVDSYLAIYFERKNGDKLLNTNPTYSSKDGQLAVYMPLKPDYDPAVFEDTQLFLPYEEIKVGKGVFDMKMDIDLVYKNGGVFQHIDFYEFVFRRQQ